MRFLLLLFVMSSACSSICDTEVKGLCIIFKSETISDRDISDSVDILQEVLDEEFVKVPRLPNLFGNKNVWVTFVDYDLYMDCVEQERGMYRCTDILGVNYQDDDIYIEWNPCIGRTAFLHELLHTVESKMFNITLSSNHQPPLFSDNMEKPYLSIEYIANWRVRLEVCCREGECI